MLGAFVLDSCSGDEAEEVRLHLESCPGCRSEIDRLGAVAGLIGANDLEVPPVPLRTAVLDAARDVP
jgi:hypothetical protein